MADQHVRALLVVRMPAEPAMSPPTYDLGSHL